VGRCAGDDEKARDRVAGDGGGVTYDAADDLRKSYDVCIAALREEFLKSRESEVTLHNYSNFIVGKSQLAGEFGFEPMHQAKMAYDFQTSLTDWAVRQGRAAIFADCGLGKTLMQLAWAQNVIQHSNKPVLIIAPLSVSLQTLEEAEKFGYDAMRSLDGKIDSFKGTVTTNYERVHHFDPDDFAGVVCDESSIMKNFDGARKTEITEFMKKVKYRLLCSATPSPNDYIELGTSSEALGQLGYMDMLAQFFKNDEDSLHPAFIGSKWRFKYHAERDFWRWMCSWSRAVRKPSDLGFDDRDWILPKLIEREHVVESGVLEGALFAMPTATLEEERQERRSTIKVRCEKAAELASKSKVSVAWCHLNAEADLLTELIPGSEQISGSDDDERKEELFQAFRHGQLKKLVTKPKIAAFGLNWQHCNHMTFFADHSFEQYYQAVRRLWRFGQKRDVTVDIVTSQSLAGVSKNLRRKADACEEMFAAMVAQMNDAMNLKRFKDHTQKQDVPSWL
jgi:hypothetical protein